MTYRKGSSDFSLNLVALSEMEEIVPMTSFERAYIRAWVKSGHDLDSNPWNYLESDGVPMNYLKAYRIRYGASHGTWDHWEFDQSWILDESSSTIIPR